MTKLETVKTAAKLVVSIGVGAVVGNAVKATSPNDMKAITKLAVMLGGCVLGSMVSDKAADYTEEKIDETVETIKEGIEEAQKEAEA